MIDKDLNVEVKRMTIDETREEMLKALFEWDKEFIGKPRRFEKFVKPRRFEKFVKEKPRKFGEHKDYLVRPTTIEHITIEHIKE